MNKALITGITGQDGYFLSQLLLSKGYEVHGLLRRNSSMKKGTFDLLPEKIQKQITLHYGDITDTNFISNLIQTLKPDEIYHLASQSFVSYSFENTSSTYFTNIEGTLNICNGIKLTSPNTKMYFSASSEMFGQPLKTPQNEDTPFIPKNPYAISKLANYWTTKTYRNAYKLFMSNGILFNHESEVRGAEFVTRKISLAIAKIYYGSTQPLILGNLNAIKDWGYAKDYIEGMYKINQYDIPDDFVLGTGKSHTVKDFINIAFKIINIPINWIGQGINEVGISNEGKTLVKVSKEFYRPLESDNYCADYKKAYTKLNWKPTIEFEELVNIMITNDLKLEGEKQ